jgi:hypothetical protein
MRKRELKNDLIVFAPSHPQWGLLFIVDILDQEVTVEELLKQDKHVRHYIPYSRLKEIRVKTPNEIPLVDCPACKNKDVPLIYKTTFTKGRIHVDIFECACCGKVPNITDDLKIKTTVNL